MSDLPFTVQRLRGKYAIVYRDNDGKRHRESLVASDRLGAEAEARPPVLHPAQPFPRKEIK